MKRDKEELTGSLIQCLTAKNRPKFFRGRKLNFNSHSHSSLRNKLTDKILEKHIVHEKQNGAILSRKIMTDLNRKIRQLDLKSRLCNI